MVREWLSVIGWWLLILLREGYHGAFEMQRDVVDFV
jgi:hypothetical protein